MTTIGNSFPSILCVLNTKLIILLSALIEALSLEYHADLPSRTQAHSTLPTPCLGGYFMNDLTEFHQRAAKCIPRSLRDQQSKFAVPHMTHVVVREYGTNATGCLHRSRSYRRDREPQCGGGHT